MKALRTLLLLGIALTVTAFSSEIISNIAGPLEYKGYVSFVYTEGENPINHIMFTIDMTIAQDLLIINIPSGWGHIYNDRVLSLSGGSLSPGGIVNVQVSLNRHHLPGDYHVDAIGTTTAGESVSTSGVLMVGETYILMFLAALNLLRYPLAASTFGLGFLEIWWRTKLKESEKGVDLEDMDFQSDDGIDIVPVPATILLDDTSETMGIDPLDPLLTITPTIEPIKTEPTTLSINGLDPETELLQEKDFKTQTQPPKLDGINYEDLFEQAVNRIPTYSPEWTDHTVNDPGITMVDLLSWISESMGFYQNYSPKDFDFLSGHELTGEHIRKIVIDSVKNANEKREPVKTEHVKAELEKLRKD